MKEVRGGGGRVGEGEGQGEERRKDQGNPKELTQKEENCP